MYPLILDYIMYLYLYVFLIKYSDDSAKDNNASNVKSSR